VDTRVVNFLTVAATARWTASGGGGHNSERSRGHEHEGESIAHDEDRTRVVAHRRELRGRGVAWAARARIARVGAGISSRCDPVRVYR
jgi:hypothetical protein